MRRLLAPLSRWLDRRIDARIAVAKAEADRRVPIWLEAQPCHSNDEFDRREAPRASWMGA